MIIFLPSCVRSLSARRAWIEIIDDLEPSRTRRVALRKESVDRNDVIRPAIDVFLVALRKESVDRNTVSARPSHAANLSLSARRAWIEIVFGSILLLKRLVALRKESVDRN